MKKFLFMAVYFLCVVVGAHAQMSDTQVMQYVAKETKAGTSQQQIVTKLMQRGVTIDQIRRVKVQYEKQQKNGKLTSSSSTASDSRLRTNNAEDYRTTKRSSQNVTVDDMPVVNPNPEELEGLQTEDDFNTLMQDSLPVSGKKIFGHDIFNNKKLSFEPNMNIATPQNYVLGPGDHVFIDIYGASQKNQELEVSPDGTIVVEGYGPVQVSGLTVSQANAKIRRGLGARYSSSQLKLTVGQTRTITVNVMGEVKTPGSYTLSAFATVFHALYMAGGVNEIGTLRNIKVFRSGRLVATADIYDYILNGKLVGNIILQENDVIIVGAYDCLANITGKVKRPMYYEMKPTESVGTLIKYAGGFTGDAYRKAVHVMRAGANGRSAYSVEEFDMNTFKVADGDSVSVDSMLVNRFENTVEVRGGVFRPGHYQLNEQVNTVRTLIAHADGVTEDAFTTRAVIHRMKADRTLEMVSVDVKGILEGTVADVPLRNEDVLFIPMRNETQNQRTITIHGEVEYPGKYQYAENETLEDFILQAGGLTDAASVAKVDVSRRIIDPKATTRGKEISKTFSFSLKDGLVFDGDRSFVLEPYDEVYVRKSPTFQEQRNVTVTGEVVFTGTYSLASKGMRMSEVIKAAGGLTEQAFLRGARLERKMTDDEKAKRDEQIGRMLLALNRDDRDYKEDSINIERLRAINIYTVGIHLDEALKKPGSEYDMILREGDNLVIPEYDNTVKMSGEVMFPNTVGYMAKKGYKWYLNQAGGVSQKGRRSKAYIIYPNGTMARCKGGVKVEPGSEIVVPTKVKRDTSSLTQWISIGTSIASLGVTIAYLVNALNK